MNIITKAESLFRQGCASLEKEPKRAITLFESALASDPRHQGALVKLASCLQDNTKKQSLLKWANAIDPSTEYGQQAALLLKEMQSDVEETVTPSESQHMATTDYSQQDNQKSDQLPTRPSVEVGQVIGGKYRIVELLSVGGQGTTFKAIDEELGQFCVAKQLVAQQGKEKELPREAKMLVTLNKPGHAGIPEIYAYDDAYQMLFIKYIDGENLYNARSELDGLNVRRGSPLFRLFIDLFNLKQKLSEDYALKYLHEVSGALTYLHNHRGKYGELSPKIHGDVTPGNLIIDVEGRVWLIDFGLTQTSNTYGNRSGTDYFIAPEQKEGKAEPRSDIYSLGKTFEYLLRLSGEQFKVSRTLSNLLKQMAKEEVSERPTAEWLRDTLEQILSLRRARRVVAGLISLLVFALLLNLALFMPQFGIAQGIKNGRQEFATIQARNIKEITSFDRLSATMAAESSTIQAQMTTENASLAHLQKTKVAERATLEALRSIRNVIIPANPIANYNINTGRGRQSGVLTSGRHSDFWTFQTNAGQSLVIKVAQGNTGELSDPVLYLFDPNGNVVGSNDDALGNYSACVELRDAQSGLYTVQVASYMYKNGQRSGLGSYQLIIEPVIQCSR